MPVETPSLFAQVIKDHLELKERNSDLDRQMPIDRYKSDDPFENHPLFKTEEQARLEETMDGIEPDFVAHSTERSSLPWPGEETAETARRRRDRGFRLLEGRSRPRLRLGRLVSRGRPLRLAPLFATGTRCLAPLSRERSLRA